MPKRKASLAEELPLVLADDTVDVAPNRNRENSRWVTYECTGCGGSSRALSGTQRHERAVCRECFGKGPDRRPRELNELSGKDWAQRSRSVEQYPDTRSHKQRLHGASFPRSLAREQIEIYTRLGQTVLDPFVGVGTTIDAALEIGRKAVGVDVSTEFVDLAEKDLAASRFSPSDYILHVGDARALDAVVEAESVDFVMTSPPYGALLRQVKGAFAYKWQEHTKIRPVFNPIPYSENPEDIGNLAYDEFLTAIREVLVQTYKVQRDGSYAVWVVKDFRALKADVPYVNYHGHFIERAEAAGFTLWDLRIWDQTKFRPLVCLGYPSRNFYLNIGHSHLVVLKKR